MGLQRDSCLVDLLVDVVRVHVDQQAVDRQELQRRQQPLLRRKATLVDIEQRVLGKRPKLKPLIQALNLDFDDRFAEANHLLDMNAPPDRAHRRLRRFSLFEDTHNF